MLQNGRALRRYRKRWKVERTFAWLQNFRRLLVCQDRLICVYQGFFHLACTCLFEILMKPALTLAVKRRRLGGCFYGFVSLLYTKYGNELH
jgi:hypothetical protein